MYRTEYTLGIVGSVLNAVGAALLLIALLAVALFGGTAEALVMMFLKDAGLLYLTEVLHFATAIAAIVLAVMLVLAIAAAVTGFIGAARLNRDDRVGAALLLTSAGLSLLSVLGVVAMILLLVGGIMALGKRPAA